LSSNSIRIFLTQTGRRWRQLEKLHATDVPRAGNCRLVMKSAEFVGRHTSLPRPSVPKQLGDAEKLCPAAKATVDRLKRSRKSLSENAKSSWQVIMASHRGLPFLRAEDIG
jgi:hypothetical protein